MAGIKDLLSLHHWLGDDQKTPLKKALKNSRFLPANKRKLLQDLADETSHRSDHRTNDEGPSKFKRGKN